MQMLMMTCQSFSSHNTRGVTQHLRADSPMLRQMVQLTRPDSPPMARGVSVHTKQGKKSTGKAHMVGWSKPTLLFISCSPNMLARRSFYVIGQQRNPGHLLKQNGPKSDATSIAYSSCDVRMLSTHLLIVDILSCSNMEWYDDELMVCAYSLCLFRLGAPPFYSF
jgi:hypothetical protein